MVWQILRRLLIPTSGCAITVVHAKSKQEAPPPSQQKEKEKEKECDPKRRLIRACELPLYTEDKACVKCSPNEQEQQSILIDTIRCARQELWLFLDQAKAVSRDIQNYYEEIIDDYHSAVEFLREDENVIPRMGAIAIGGLTGYIIGLRKGPVRRFFFTSAGALGMAALCYPREAQEYTQEATKVAKKYILISYHFVNGVSRDLTGYQLPPLPSGHDPAEVVPSSAQLLPPTATATHIPMPFEEKSEEVKKQLHDQSHPADKELYTRRTS